MIIYIMKFWMFYTLKEATFSHNYEKNIFIPTNVFVKSMCRDPQLVQCNYY